MTLPIRVQPIPGESLVSWLAAHATRMKCWWGELLSAVLPAGAELGRYGRDLRLVARLSDDHRDAIADATHTDAADVAAMTLAGRYGQPLITIDPDSGRPDTPWGKISRQRFCPLCLKSHPGRDRLEWLLPWITTCPEHQCYLADACTHNGHHQCLSPTWLRLLALPPADRCRGILHTASAPARCTARLSNAPVVRIRRDDPVLAAQQTLSEWLSHPQIDRGLYSAAPARPNEFLHDVLQLRDRLLDGAEATDLLNMWGYRATERRVMHWDNALRVRQAGQDNSIKSARIVAAPAAVVSAWVTTAMAIVTKPSIAEAAAALRNAEHMTEKSAPERSRPQTVRYSPALAAADTMSRSRCIDVFAAVNDSSLTQHPQRGREGDSAGETMLRAIRSGLWTPWTLGLNTGMLSWTMHCQTLTRLLLAMESTMAGPDANRRLNIHPTANSVINSVARRLYAHPQWTVIRQALERLHRYLRATPPPIDYQRRRELDYRHLINERQWEQVTAVLDMPIRHRPDAPSAVRNWLIEQLGGPAPRNAAGKLMPRDGGQDFLRAHFSRDLLATLDSIAIDFLHARGITDEPLRWTPPTILLNGLDLPGATASASHMEQIHDLIDQGYTVYGASRALDLPIEVVRFGLEQHPCRDHASPGPKPVPTPALDWLRTVLPEPKLRDLYDDQHLARNTIARLVAAEHGRTVDHRTLETLMREYGIEQRTIAGPTAEWIQRQHIACGRTFTDMAAELGVRPQAIGKCARSFGIPTHRHSWHHAPDQRSLQVLAALAIDPKTCGPRLPSTHMWRNLQILVETSRHSSFSAAAVALGCAPCAVSAHIRALEKAFGHRVCDRATKKRPLTLTGFGQQLVALTTAIEFGSGS
ncbi:TniQ family protein [Mycobacterium sp. 48b]|uniref:TniQ family protein n=1 Tax=Mycobacterium sp. 48b TaxID=3400426 RepID=UPI003AAA2C86